MRHVLLSFLLLIQALVAWASTDSTEVHSGPWKPEVITADSARTLPFQTLREVNSNNSSLYEELVYTVRYGFIAAGEARLVTEPGPTYGGRSTVRVVGTGRSTGAFDWVFKVRDHYESHVDQAGLFPHRFIRSVREGGYRMERDIAFEPSKRTATTTEKGRTRIQVLPDYCQDLVSAFHFARHLPLDSIAVGEVVQIPTFLDGKVHQVRARKTGEERIAVKAGEFWCWTFKPLVMKGRIWKDEDDLTVYVSADQFRVPVLVKTNLVVGSVRLELISAFRTPRAPSPQ